MTARKRFEGRDLAGTELVVAGAVLEHGDAGEDDHRVGAKVHVVVEAVVDKITHRPVKDTNTLTRVEHARALVVALVDVASVADVLEAARVAVEEREGVLRLDLEAP